MSTRPVIPIRMTPGKPSPEQRAAVDPHWRGRYLMLAPHRLAFFLAMVVLAGSGGWWALVQIDRISGVAGLHYAVSPTLVHAAVMVFGFVPLFFSGFLFTAAPKWLAVSPLDAPRLLAPLLFLAGGWIVWLAGAHWLAPLATLGLVLALVGLVWVSFLYWRLVRLSRAEDQVHARVIGVACIVGCLSLGAVAVSLMMGALPLALAWVRVGLWGFVLVVFVSVAHRMIPFFTSSTMPMIAVWRPFWVLWLMLATAAIEVAAVWVELDGPPGGALGSAWVLARGLVELVVGGILVWLAVVWGLVQSLKNRLLAMLHIGFLWLGLALLLAGVSQLLGLLLGKPVLSLGALHALTMGCLASLMIAMVTRVSCGHSGRALVADTFSWTLFWLLQAATVLRIAAAAQGSGSAWLLLLAALLWAGVMAVWGVRLGGWFGRLRADGRPG